MTCLYCPGARSGRQRPPPVKTLERTLETLRDNSDIFTLLYSDPAHSTQGQANTSTFSDLHPTIDNFSRKYAKENNFFYPFWNPEY